MGHRVTKRHAAADAGSGKVRRFDGTAGVARGAHGAADAVSVGVQKSPGLAPDHLPFHEGGATGG
jgi:hypothetical protein